MKYKASKAALGQWKTEYKVLLVVLVILIGLVLWGMAFGNRLEALLYKPLKTPEEWCKMQPCITIPFFETSIIIVKPTSSFIVFFLGFQTIAIGIFLMIQGKREKSHLWWGVALILWGLGALFAGMSYQAFSFMLKCSGRSFCVWTSWWEIIYLIFSVGSVDAMLISQAYSCVLPKNRKILLAFGLVSFTVYFSVVLIGAFIPIRFLISFELMVVFLIPNILFFLGLNLRRYRKNQNPMDKNLLLIWISLIVIIGLYFLYLILGITAYLWEYGIWFSENDILHIGLIIWMFFILYTVKNHVVDLNRVNSDNQI